MLIPDAEGQEVVKIDLSLDNKWKFLLNYILVYSHLMPLVIKYSSGTTTLSADLFGHTLIKGHHEF